MNRGNVAPEVFYLTDAPNSPGSLAMLLAMRRRVSELAAWYENVRGTTQPPGVEDVESVRHSSDFRCFLARSGYHGIGRRVRQPVHDGPRTWQGRSNRLLHQWTVFRQDLLLRQHGGEDTVYGKPFGQSRQSAGLLLIEASRLSLGFDKLAYCGSSFVVVFSA